MGKFFKPPVVPEVSPQMDPRFVSVDTQEAGNSQFKISKIQSTRP